MNTENSKSSKAQQAQIVYVAQPPDYAEDEINLLDYWRVLLRFKWLIVVITLLSTAAAVVHALLADEVFEAEVVFMPASEEGGGALSGMASQFGGLAALAGVNLGGGGGGKTEEALATLSSRAFTLGFIEEFELMPVFYAGLWDDDAQQWIPTDEKERPTAWKAYKMFNDGIRSVANDATTGMITLSISWGDPVLAAQWANALINKINAHQKASAIKEAERSIAYLKNQLEQTSVVGMRAAIFNLIEAQTKNIMFANVRDEYAFKIIDPAVVPEQRIKPKRKLIVILGFMVGFMLSIFLAFLINFIRNQKQGNVDNA